MEFKTDEDGVYVRKCREEEFNYTPTRLSRIAKIAFSNKKEESTYEIIYFTKNTPRWSKFDEDVKFLACRFFTSNELLEIVDKTLGMNNYLARKVIIKDDKFEVFDDEVSYQGKIEPYHRSMKNVVKLDNYFSPGQLEAKMEEFVKYYNYQRYHESLQNLTPAEVYFGTGQKKLKQRKLIKNRTLNARKKQFCEN